MTEMILDLAKRKDYNKICDEVSNEGLGANLVVNYNGNQIYGTIKITFKQSMNEDLDKAVIKILHKIYCENE